MPSAKAPQGFKARGRIVCNCFNVAETEIDEVLAKNDWVNCATQEEVLVSVQEKLKCGTNCGSCVPELKKSILARSPSAKLA